ncbi:MAG: tRNA (adenosine(37)-N6)-dimethylallyltransferase MiaA, partial [Crocinitomicaceae bacterium]|nr:tRNA (adenosine(37)-N6)-dimethylallyltransferase MiaA [Crocinitomicaceae bacterium]
KPLLLFLIINQLIVISGPTASGKTSLSVELAKHFNTCVLSADSRQFYQEISIGTAKPTKEEMDGVPHYFIDSHKLKDEVTAAQFEREALELLEQLFQLHNVIILTGGSGMFVDALCNGLDDIPTSKELRNELQNDVDQGKLESLLEELKLKDPVYFEQVDRKNPVRVIRAIEVIRLTDLSYSELRKSAPKERPFTVKRFVIEHDREFLYDRINRRVDIMLEAGLLEEVKSVIEFRHLSSMNTVGYKELFNYLDGDCSLEDAIELIKQNSRRYAKRQITWLKRNTDAQWVPYSATEKMVEQIMNHLKTDQSWNDS